MDTTTYRHRVGPVGDQVRQRITVARNAKGISQAELGRRLGMDRSSVNWIENGYRRIDVDDLCSIAAILDVTPAELLP